MAGLALAAACASQAFAGPPYITDDPEPTDTGHFENYLYIEGTHAAGAFGGPSTGAEINYGVFPETQLTFSFPLDPNPGPGGMGIVWAPLGVGAKYRFVDEDVDGWRPEVAFFPSVAIPIGSATRTSPTTEFFPIWLQKNFGGWSFFGGGGWTHNPGFGNRDFASYGGAVAYQAGRKLQLGLEVFGATRSAANAAAATALGVGEIFDVNDSWHLIGSVNKGIVNPALDRFSYNFALKWTF